MATVKIDFDVLKELKEMLEDEFEELIETYLRDTKKKIERLSDSINAADHDSVRKIAHSMKGASVNLGVMAFGELCSQLEEDAKNGQIDTFSKQFSGIQTEATIVFNELEKLCDS